MADPFQRLWERIEARGKIGGRRLYETNQRAKEWVGEGGVKLKRAERDVLGQRAYTDPTGLMFKEIRENRQASNKLEGTKNVPVDYWVFLRDLEAKMQAAGDGQ